MSEDKLKQEDLESIRNSLDSYIERFSDAIILFTQITIYLANIISKNFRKV